MGFFDAVVDVVDVVVDVVDDVVDVVDDVVDVVVDVVDGAGDILIGIAEIVVDPIEIAFETSDYPSGDPENNYIDDYGWVPGESDVMTGDSGADTFVLGSTLGVYYLGAGRATITDFNRAEGDLIQVTGSLSDYSLTPYEGGMILGYQQGEGQKNVIAYLQNNTDASLSYDFTVV